MEINPESLNSIDDVRGLFIEWTNRMDKLYGQGTKERVDGASWTKGNPAEWMNPFNQELFDAWLHYDARLPTWEDDAKEAINETSLYEAMRTNNTDKVKQIEKRVSEGKVIRIF